MKLRIEFSIRKFNKDDEYKDSGYYNELTCKRHGKIDINIEDAAFEQILTIYHEITHFILDYVSQYKLDTKHKRMVRRDTTVKKEWRKLNSDMEDSRKDRTGIEELICCKVERVVSPVLRKHIPKDFFKKFFK